MCVVAKDLNGNDHIKIQTFKRGFDYEQCQRLRELVKGEIATFNGVSYDLPILAAMIKGSDTATVNALSQRIINGSKPGWLYIQVPFPKKHIDLMNCLEVIMSLKMCGARLHSRTIQDLPVNPYKEVTREEAQTLFKYCMNDVLVSEDLLHALKDRIEVREALDLDNATARRDVNIAEKYLQGHRKLQHHPPNAYFARKFTLNLLPIRFKSIELKTLYNELCRKEFSTNNVGKVLTRFDTSLELGYTDYTVGLGGLHSKDSSLMAKDCYLYDVSSYYPNLIIKLGLLGDVYKRIYEARVDAKSKGNKRIADSYKLILNASYGKMGSTYSVLYNPQGMLSVTVNGQLLLLKLIEMCEDKVISANTDGIVTREPIDDIVKAWSEEFDMICEKQEVDLYCARDVNNYFLTIRTQGKDGEPATYIKGKGIFGEPNLKKAPHAWISSLAAIRFLADGIPIEDTIMNHEDVRDFLFVRLTKGGSSWNEQHLGRVARWIWVKRGFTIKYPTGHKVPNSENAYPLMVLPKGNAVRGEKFEVDYKRYIDLAKEYAFACLGE